MPDRVETVEIDRCIHWQPKMPLAFRVPNHQTHMPGFGQTHLIRAPRDVSQPRGISPKGMGQDDCKSGNSAHEWQRDKGLWPDGEIDRTAG